MPREVIGITQGGAARSQSFLALSGGLVAGAATAKQNSPQQSQLSSSGLSECEQV
jgi:hypothetical protein